MTSENEIIVNIRKNNMECYEVDIENRENIIY